MPQRPLPPMRDVPPPPVPPESEAASDAARAAAFRALLQAEADAHEPQSEALRRADQMVADSRRLIRAWITGAPFVQGVWPGVVLSIDDRTRRWCTVRLIESGSIVGHVRYDPTLPQVGGQYAIRRTVQLNMAAERGAPELVQWSLKVESGRWLYRKRGGEVEMLRYPWPPPSVGVEWAPEVVQPSIDTNYVLLGGATPDDAGTEVALTDEQFTDDVWPEGLGVGDPTGFRQNPVQLVHFEEMGFGDLTRTYQPTPEFSLVGAIANDGMNLAASNPYYTHIDLDGGGYFCDDDGDPITTPLPRGLPPVCGPPVIISGVPFDCCVDAGTELYLFYCDNPPLLDTRAFAGTHMWAGLPDLLLKGERALELDIETTPPGDPLTAHEFQVTSVTCTVVNFQIIYHPIEERVDYSFPRPPGPEFIEPHGGEVITDVEHGAWNPDAGYVAAWAWCEVPIDVPVPELTNADFQAYLGIARGDGGMLVSELPPVGEVPTLEWRLAYDAETGDVIVFGKANGQFYRLRDGAWDGLGVGTLIAVSRDGVDLLASSTFSTDGGETWEDCAPPPWGTSRSGIRFIDEIV